MKRLLASIIILLLFFVAEGQILIYSSASPLSSEPPAFLAADGYTWGWWKMDVGITMDGSNRVSLWEDQVNSHDLTQASANQQPLFTADFGVRFGTDAEVDEFLITDQDLAISSPQLLYAVVNNEVFTIFKVLLSSYTDNSVYIWTAITSPQIAFVAGNLVSDPISLLTAGSWHIIRFRINDTGYISGLAVDNNAEVVLDDTYAVGLDGLTLGNFNQMFAAEGSRVAYKEIIIRETVDSEVNQAAVYNYLNRKYSLGLTEL